MAERHELIRRRIVDLPTAKKWIEDLQALDLMFHFEDDPDSIIDGGPNGTHGALFDTDEVTEVRRRVVELYSLSWPKEFECPIGYALSLISPNWRNDE